MDPRITQLVSLESDCPPTAFNVHIFVNIPIHVDTCILYE